MTDIWFRGKTIVEILRYAIQRKAIRDHVDPEDKRKLSELAPKSKQNENGPLKIQRVQNGPLTNNEKTQFISTSLDYTA